MPKPDGHVLGAGRLHERTWRSKEARRLENACKQDTMKNKRCLKTLSLIVKLCLLLGLFGYRATVAFAAAPIGQIIWLRANANNLFVSADQNLGTNLPLAANSSAMNVPEQFKVVDAGGG